MSTDPAAPTDSATQYNPAPAPGFTRAQSAGENRSVQ